MAISRWTDRLLLASLLPIWLVVFGLHVREVWQSGLAQPAVFVTNPKDAESYPQVGGFRPEQGGKVPGLRVGDQLIRAGDIDLRGVGNIALDAILIEQAGNDLSVGIEYEREGRRGEMTLELSRLAVPWMRIPALLTLVFTAVLVLVRAPAGAQPQIFFVAFMSLAVLQTPFHGGSYVQTYLSKLIFYLLNVLVPPLVLRWALFFPREAPPPPRRMLAIPWLVLLVGAFVRANYFLGGPVPPEIAPRLGPAWDASIIAVMLALLTFNYHRADRIGRRRIKWFLYGAYLGGLPFALTMVMPLFDPDGTWYTRTLVFPALSLCAVPLGLLIAIVRQQLFDIDRLISATASYSVLVGVLVAGALTVVPRMAQAASAVSGIDVEASQFALSLALAFTILPAQKRLRPLIDDFFFPERRALEVGIERLLEKLSVCESPRELVDAMGQELSELIRAEKCVIYARGDNAFVPVFTEGVDKTAPIELGSPMIAVLERRMVPVVAEGASGPRAARHLSPFERATLEELKVSVVAPIRGRREMVAFFCLGPKRSGDIYTSSDVALLAAVTDRVSTKLMRFEDSDIVQNLQGADETAARDNAEEGGLLWQPSPLTGSGSEAALPATVAMDQSGTECPQCGTCYDSRVSRCDDDAATLVRLPVPRILADRYRLDRRLGSGGMGTVYEATDASLERRVAVKLIREELAGSSQAAVRFQREARATAGFTHGNVVTVHDFGLCQGVHPFLVMELLRGRSLAEELETEGRLPPEQVLEIFQGVCAAVEAAHERQLIHRDLKPANIFLSVKSQGGVKVLDFGLAKFLSDSSEPGTATHSGVLLGTIHYMAPERFEGHSVAPKWDLWALGVIAYEMLAGVRLFEGASVAEVQAKILSGKFKPIAEHLPDAPADWQLFFERALAPSSDDRPNSAKSLCDALERALA